MVHSNIQFNYSSCKSFISFSSKTSLLGYSFISNVFLFSRNLFDYGSFFFSSSWSFISSILSTTCLSLLCEWCSYSWFSSSSLSKQSKCYFLFYHWKLSFIFSAVLFIVGIFFVFIQFVFLSIYFFDGFHF